MTLEPETDAEVALLRAGRPRSAEPMDRRRLRAEGVAAGTLIAAAIALGTLAHAARDWNVVSAVLLCLLFAAAVRLPFDVGAGYTAPVQLAFVPMLLLLPTPWVPLLVAVSWLAGKLPDVQRGTIHPDRLLLPVASAWFAIGPALVLILGHAQTPDWGDWPWYVLALAAQFAFDLANGQLRESFGRGIAFTLQLRMLGWVQAVDAMLSPIGLLAAFASTTGFAYAFLLLVPPAGLLFGYARERARRLENALALAEAARARQELIAGASHELVTPVAVLTGLTRRLERTSDPAVVAAMSRELAQLRHRVRQFVDYTRLKTGRELRIAARDTDVGEVVRDVVGAYAPAAGVRADLPDALPSARVDPDRLQQMLMSLIANAVTASPPGAPIVVSARDAPSAVEVTVADEGEGIAPEAQARLFAEGRAGGGDGAGLGLYLVNELLQAQGGAVRVDSAPGAGSRFTLVLPRAG